jgi:plasmid stability protein
MPSLQIRDLPEPLHRLLQHRARAHKRSISQQALVDLEAIAGGDARERRRLVLDRIARRGPLTTVLTGDQTPEALIRADRER